jgi:glutathione synthase/RimK-type ligase-like ATP-grasp enzyme
VILLIGQSNDPPLRAVAAELERMGATYLFVNGNTKLLKPWQPRSEAVLSVSGKLVPLEEVRSAYLRPLGLGASESERQAFVTLLAWADQAPALVVNRPTASLPNNSKPLQAQWIIRLGLRVPETLITTDPQAASDFVRLHKEVVYKSTSGVRSIVRRLSRERFAELQNVRHCPTQFQRYIPGNDLRVHVVGETISALRIASDRDDYRYAARDGGAIEVSRVELDATLADSLRAVVRQMSLLVAGIDLRRTPTGEFYCLEINPSPAFTYYEQLAGVALARAIAELLV